MLHYTGGKNRKADLATHMLTIMELDQDSYWKRGQEYLWWQAFQHCSCSSPLDDLVFVVCEVYLQDCGRRVLNGIWHVQCRRQANLHADMEKRECWKSFCLC